MKRFFIFICLIIAFVVWFEDWTSSGKMDVFIEENENPNVTPKVIYWIGELCFFSQEARAANHYYRWVIDKYPEEDFMPRVRFHLAQTYEELGDKAKAMEQYVVLKDSFTATEFGVMAKKKWEMTRF